MIPPSIVYSIWDNKTQAEWLESDSHRLGADKQCKCAVGTIIVCVNTETKTMFGVGILGTPFVPANNAGVYTGADAKYNKYEAELHHFRKFAAPISFEAVNRICDIRSDDIIYNSYTRNVWANFVKLRYRPKPDTAGPDEPTVAQRFRELVMTWI